MGTRIPKRKPVVCMRGTMIIRTFFVNINVFKIDEKRTYF